MADNRHGEERRPAAGAPRAPGAMTTTVGQRRGEGDRRQIVLARIVPGVLNRSTDGERNCAGAGIPAGHRRQAAGARYPPRTDHPRSRAPPTTIAKHLVAAGELLDDDPEAALAHAQAARTRSGRIAAVREAVGIAAYHCGDWAQALAELRAARRMGSKSALLPLIADCERGVGRPERAIELARTPEAAELTGDDADELRIVVAGARADMGQLEQALAVLSSPQPDPARTGQTAARLCYAYAEALLALGRSDEALQWFLKAAEADSDGVTDAEDRIGELAD